MRANVNLKDRVNSGSRASPEIFEGSPSKRLVFGKSQSLNTRQLQLSRNQLKGQEPTMQTNQAPKTYQPFLQNRISIVTSPVSEGNT